jgi:hypothetical protein
MLSEAVNRHIDLHRSMGFKYAVQAYMLRSFAASQILRRRGARTLSRQSRFWSGHQVRPQSASVMIDCSMCVAWPPR